MRSMTNGQNSVTVLGLVVLTGIIAAGAACSRTPLVDSGSTTQAESSGDASNQNARQRTVGIDSNGSGNENGKVLGDSASADGFRTDGFDGNDRLANGTGCGLPPELSRAVGDASKDPGCGAGASSFGSGGWGAVNSNLSGPNKATVDGSKMNLRNVDLKTCAWNGKLPVRSLFILDSADSQSFVHPLAPGVNCNAVLARIKRNSADKIGQGSVRCETFD